MANSRRASRQIIYMFLSLTADTSQSLTLALALMSIFTPTYKELKRYAAIYQKHVMNSIMTLQIGHLPCCSIACDAASHRLALFPTFTCKWKI
jgi:hypothetical protein